jgi:hypothetical protein
MWVYHLGRNKKMQESQNCPRCGKGLIVHGSFSTRSLKLGFRPEELRLFSLSLQFPEVPMPANGMACASCGLVWTELDTATLRQKLHDLGNDEVQKRLGMHE